MKHLYFPGPPEVKIACFRDTSTPSGFPEMLADYTASIDFDNINSTVLDCAQEAFSRGQVFGFLFKQELKLIHVCNL